MTITTEEAEWLAKQHDLVRFTLGMKAPKHDLTAATIRSLAADRDALQARVAELEGLLSDARDDLTDWIDVAHPHREKYPHIMQDFENDMEIGRRIDAALEGKKDA